MLQVTASQAGEGEESRKADLTLCPCLTPGLPICALGVGMYGFTTHSKCKVI